MGSHHAIVHEMRKRGNERGIRPARDARTSLIGIPKQKGKWITFCTLEESPHFTFFTASHVHNVHSSPPHDGLRTDSANPRPHVQHVHHCERIENLVTVRTRPGRGTMLSQTRKGFGNCTGSGRTRGYGSAANILRHIVSIRETWL